MDLVTCCITLTDNSTHAGCGGGYEQKGFQYWINTGLPTKSCKPFLFGDNEKVAGSPKLKCETSCYQSSENLYRYSGSFQRHISNAEEEIKTEIYYNGPVTAAFTVYYDFFNFWGNLNNDPYGIYEHTNKENSTVVSHHAIKIIGWGYDKNLGKKYWLCVNSWGTNDKISGFFRFIRGKNNCGIESDINAGYVNDRVLFTNKEPVIVQRNKFFSFKNLDKDFE